MRQFLPLEFEGSHALGAKMATVACGMSSEMRKPYITSTAGELKTPAGASDADEEKKKPKTNSQQSSYTFGVDAEFPR